MNREERAKQFAPFGALKGLREAMREKELELERVQKHEITDEMREEMQAVLVKLDKGSQVKICFYDCGYYKELDGKVKTIDFVKKLLTVNEIKIHFDDLFLVELIS